MEVINWANGKGTTLILSMDELNELTGLVEALKRSSFSSPTGKSYFTSHSSEHFKIKPKRD